MFILFENLTFSLVSVKYDFCMEPEQFKREKSDFKVTDHRISVKPKCHFVFSCISLGLLTVSIKGQKEMCHIASAACWQTISHHGANLSPGLRSLTRYDQSGGSTDWKKKLTPEQYTMTRERGTEEVSA